MGVGRACGAPGWVAVLLTLVTIDDSPPQLATLCVDSDFCTARCTAWVAPKIITASEHITTAVTAGSFLCCHVCIVKAFFCCAVLPPFYLLALSSA